MRRIAVVVAAVIPILTILGARPALADPAPNIELISANAAGSGGNGSSGEFVADLDVSADGRYVVFDSYATDLVPGDSNGSTDVFVRDRTTGTTSLADVDNSGNQGSSYAELPRISADGRYVAFITGSALVPDDTNGAADVYVRDLVDGITTRVSQAPDGGQLSQGVSGTHPPQISANGRYVAYDSYSPELSGVSNESADAIAVTDRDSDGNGVYDEPGETSTTVVAPDGTLGSMSPNGRYIGYLHDINGDFDYQTFVVDRGAPEADGSFDQPESTTLVSATPDGSPGDGDSGPGYVSNAGDVAFWSEAEDIGGSPNDPAVLLRDAATGSLQVISSSMENQPSISSDGRYVAYTAPYGNTRDAAVVTDVSTGVTTAVSVDSDGNAVEGINPQLSSTGAFTAFSSTSTALPGGNPSTFNVYLNGAPTDSTPPTVTITTPADGASYAVGQSVTANYSCADPSGVQSCDGPVASGGAVDTSTPGTHTFSVTATDDAGNTGTTSTHYTVGTGISVGDTQVSEGNTGTTSMVFPVTLDRPSATAVKVSYATSDGTATAGSDYTAKSGTLTIPAGSTTGSISVSVKGDTQVEPDETVDLTLSHPTPAASTFVERSPATGTINNDDVASNISIGDAAIPEGNSGTSMMTFPLTLDRPAGAAIKLTYTTADGTATAGSDYRAKSGSLTLPAGATSGSISVTVNGDVTPEPDETFTVNLTGITSGPGVIARGTAIGTIQNDDTAATASIGNASQPEGNRGTTPMTFPVTLDRTAAAAIKISYTTQDGTAVAPGDYTTKSGTLTIAKGASAASITVSIKGDRVVEPDETFSVVLTGVVSGPAVISSSQGSGTGTIINDD